MRWPRLKHSSSSGKGRDTSEDLSLATCRAPGWAGHPDESYQSFIPT